MKNTYCLPALAAAIALSSSGLSAQIESDDVLPQEIVITATRTEKSLLEIPASVSVQNMEDLEQRGFVHGTDEFRGVPGMFVRNGEGDAEEFPFISIRGITGNHGNDTFLAMIDGIPFVGPDEEVILYQLPYSIVDSVEIVRGPVSALYGRGGIAGAVNYLTKTPATNSSSVTLSLGDDDYRKADWVLERAGESGSFLFTASHQDYEGWRENSAREVSSLFLKGTTELGTSGELSAYLNYFDRDAEVPSTIPTLADGTIVDVIGGDESFIGYSPTWNKQQGWIAALSYDWAIHDDLQLKLTGQYRDFDSDVRLNFYDYFEFDPANNTKGINGFASPAKSDVLFGEAVLTWQVNRHNLVVGINAEKTNVDEHDLWTGQNGFTLDCGFKFYAVLIDYSTGQVLNENAPCFVSDELRAADTATNSFFGFFVQDEITLTEQLTLTVGGRYDTFDRDAHFTVVGASPVDLTATGDEGNFSPKVSLAYNYGNGTVYASYGEGFNSNFGPLWQWDPASYERVEKPTTIDSFELGWKARQGDLLQWETAIFQMSQENRRTFVSNPDPAGPATLATTGQEYSSRGMEAALRITPSDRTNLIFNYTWLDPEWDEFVVDSFGGPLDYSGTTPQGVPENIFSADVEHWFTERLKLGMTYEWYDDYFITVDNAYQGGSYELMTLFGSFRLTRDRDWYVDVAMTNALDNHYYHFFGGSRTAVTNVTPGAPRQIRASLRMDF